ncbi:MAG: hypothetical protein HUU22_04995 [Phycisphaerae bacterium]|nr:hypothetical protein [Phycisphaerae bacterium]
MPTHAAGWRAIQGKKAKEPAMEFMQAIFSLFAADSFLPAVQRLLGDGSVFQALQALVNSIIAILIG